MRILVTNDDGFDAPGLAVLARLAESIGEVFVVAPREGWSGCGHRICTDRPIAVEHDAPRRFTVDAFPADCVRLGLAQLVGPVDWVLAGINDGGNLGSDVYMSGTVAAAREAALHGTRAIAVSQYRGVPRHADWESTAALVERLLRKLIERPLEPGQWWNVNLPDVPAAPNSPALIECPLDRSPLPTDYRREDRTYHYCGSYQHRPRHPEADVHHCFSGHVTLTRMTLG